MFVAVVAFVAIEVVATAGVAVVLVLVALLLPPSFLLLDSNPRKDRKVGALEI
jgi:hypothetical protein